MIGFLLQADTSAVSGASTEESIRLIDILFKGGPVMIPLIILILDLDCVSSSASFCLSVNAQKLTAILSIAVLDKVSLGQFDSANLMCDQAGSSHRATVIKTSRW
jgi:hypothetical protein